MLATRVNGSEWELNVSSVDAKVREGVTDGANKVFDVLYENYHGKNAKKGCSLQCSVATEPQVNAEWLVLKCTLHRIFTEQEMLDSGYGKAYPPATEYNGEYNGISTSGECPAHFCPANHKFISIA